tara:strand:+ start:340 stop:660 length:321 start_codon:yes stop_codon:yes gene_type:complete
MKITKTLLKQIIKEEYDKESKKQATWIADEYGIAKWTYKGWTLIKRTPDDEPDIEGPKGAEVWLDSEYLSIRGESESSGYESPMAEVVNIPLIVLKEILKEIMNHI